MDLYVVKDSSVSALIEKEATIKIPVGNALNMKDLDKNYLVIE